jgi:hypothetical protein
MAKANESPKTRQKSAQNEAGIETIKRLSQNSKYKIVQVHAHEVVKGLKIRHVVVATCLKTTKHEIEVLIVYETPGGTLRFSKLALNPALRCRVNHFKKAPTVRRVPGSHKFTLQLEKITQVFELD